MARPLRIEMPGGYYHVINRGNARMDVFLDDRDRLEFLSVLGAAVKKYNLTVHAYCLMSNHYHLLVDTPEGNLARAIRQLNGVYGQRCNRRHGRSGHVFQGRYRSVLIEKDSYLQELSRYIVLNPVRAGMVKHPRQWKWSSYRATVGEAERPEWLTVDETLGMYSTRGGVARRRYREFVAAGIETGGEMERAERRSPILGGAKFIRDKRPLLNDLRAIQAIPKSSRYADRPPLAEVLAGIGRRPPGKRGQAQRRAALKKAHEDYGYTLRAIAEHIGMHEASVSNIIRLGRSYG